MKQFKTYKAAVDFLIHDVPKTSRRVFDDSAAIERNFALMKLFNNPQNQVSSVHAAATSGKGTICYLIDAVLRAHSKRSGLVQSPHVYDIRERIQLNGQIISEKLFQELLVEVLDRAELSKMDISYFETLIAMAYVTFSRNKLDYQIIETGLGGRLDATNVITRSDKVSILGQIGLDHVEILGNTLEKVATEKAGIIQKESHVIALRQDPVVNAVFEKRCKEQNATLEWVEGESDYQKTNDAVARKVCQYLASRDGWKYDGALVESVLQQVFIPGRFEKRHFDEHLVILDGAHNPQKLAALVGRVQREGKAPMTVLLSLGDSKDLVSCLKILQPIAKRIIATEYFTKQQDIPVRPVAADAITDACRKLGIESISKKYPHEAFATALTFAEPIVATGSFFLVGELDSEF